MVAKLGGGFAKSPGEECPAGSFRVDMPQPMANVAAYLLEPQAAAGFAGPGAFDSVLGTLRADTRIVYPVCESFRIPE